jgi:LuxR family transcriptional regulator, maltose regulon positive regulatory protein
MALYEANMLADAEREFFRFRDVIAHAAFHDHLAVSYIAVARIYDFQGQHSKALEILDEAEAISYASQWPRIGHVILWERVRRELVSGDLQRAKALAERAEHLEHGPVDRVGWVRYSEEVHGQTIGRLRLKAICHDPDEALRSIIPVLNAARHKGRVYRQIKLLQLASIAHWRKQSDSGSQRYLKEALQLAATGRYTRSFLEEGALLDQALRDYLTGVGRDEESVSGGQMHSFLRELADAQSLPGELSSRETPTGNKHPSLNQQFTKRELRILGLLATFASTQAMQETLNLSKDGLKFHLRNIYTKLGVNKRVDAIRLAKQMGL